MLPEDGQIARDALVAWFTQLKINNPLYQGNLYIICFPHPYPSTMPINGVERWLLQSKYSAKGVNFTLPPNPWGALNILPPNYQNPSAYIPPTDIVILSFVDEVMHGNYSYHGSSFNFLNPTQPTQIYNSDYNTMMINKNTFNSFKQVLYPINKGYIQPFVS